MPFGRKLLVASLLAALLGLSVFWIAPLGVAGGVHAWLWWQARRQGLKMEIGKIDAPLLRPVVIERLRLSSANNAPCRIDLKTGRTIVHLQLARILTGASGRAIRSLAIEELRLETHCHASGETEKSKLAWPAIRKLLPQSFTIAKLDLRIENGSTNVLLRDASLSASPVEAGRFDAGDLTISSPLFRQTFSHLHAATSWADNRLTLGDFNLASGLVVQSMTTDLSQLGKQRVAVEFDAGAFGGKLRASVASDWHDGRSNWNIAGSATEVSLAQTSEAFGFTNRIGGLLHACKFTFRGEARDLSRATASIWLELSNSSWAGRTSEVIMLGAALYNRQIQLQQLYVKQRNNQLTMSGEGALPSNSSDWLSPDFRGDISASIHDLGDFAGLFGAKPGDFAGQIAIEGTMNARDRKIGGQLALNGASLTLFKTSIDSLTANLGLKASELEIEQFELKRKSDSLSAQGRIDMSHAHNYSGELNATIKNVAEYLSILRGPAATEVKPAPADIQIKIESGVWDVHGLVTLPGSSPFDFTAGFPLRIGADWNAFVSSPLSVTLSFPSIFLANAPQFFHPPIFEDGILSGKLSLSGTLQHPRIAGDAQLLNGKLQNAPMSLTEANGRILFTGERASIEFLNMATRDVDLSLCGDVDLQAANDLSIKILGLVPIFDLTARAVDCAGKIAIAPTGITLSPAIEELEFRGDVFKNAWAVNLKEGGTVKTVGLCFGSAAAEDTLMLGAHPRPTPATGRLQKRVKRP